MNERVTERQFKIAVGIFVGPWPRQAATGKVDAEPESLDAGEVLDNAGWAERRWRDGRAESLVIGQASDLVDHSGPDEVEQPGQDFPLRAVFGRPRSGHRLNRTWRHPCSIGAAGRRRELQARLAA